MSIVSHVADMEEHGSLISVDLSAGQTNNNQNGIFCWPASHDCHSGKPFVRTSPPKWVVIQSQESLVRDKVWWWQWEWIFILYFNIFYSCPRTVEQIRWIIDQTIPYTHLAFAHIYFCGTNDNKVLYKICISQCTRQWVYTWNCEFVHQGGWFHNWAKGFPGKEERGEKFKRKKKKCLVSPYLQTLVNVIWLRFLYTTAYWLFNQAVMDLVKPFPWDLTDSLGWGSWYLKITGSNPVPCQ